MISLLKRGLTILLLLVAALHVAAAEKIDSSNPYEMITQVADKTFRRLKVEQPLVRENPEYLKTIVAEELMPYVNVQYAALKLLGPNLRGAKKEDVLEFIDAFRQYLITNYAQILTQYHDQHLQFAPEQKLEEDDRISTAKVTILDAPNPNIDIEFKMRKDKSGEWQAFDMIAEGISLLSAKQSEWNGKIRQEGILAVAKELEQMANQPIKLKEITQ